MAFIDITSVERFDVGVSVKSWVDTPAAGTRVDGYYLKIAGWIHPAGQTVAGVAVRLKDGLFVGSASMFPRPDVNEYLALPAHHGTGFRIWINVITLPADFEITVEAVIVGQETALLFARVLGRRSRVRTDFQPTLQPLSVTSLGRTGTTLLVQMLASHSEILAHRVFPYETRIAGWWLHALTILSGHSHESSHPDTFLDQNHTFTLGFNPWALDADPNGDGLRAWFRGMAVEQTAAFCQRQIEQTYMAIAHDQQDRTGRYFIEKAVPTHIPRICWQLYSGMKEIFLVRDFRDMLCSMTAFDIKRGQTDFRHDDADMDAFLVRIVGDFQRLVHSLEERRAVSLLVRYEDLVLEPATMLRRILSYLDLDASDGAVRSMVDASESEPGLLGAHRTTASAAVSVGRYRTELSPAIQQRALALGAHLLETLGYPSE